MPTTAPGLTLAAFRAEWLKLRYRPATWMLGVLLVAGVLTLGYALLYVAILLIERAATGGDQSAGSQVLREGLAPARLVGQVLPLLHQIGGPIALILGALAAGSEYGWGTLKTILTQRPGRLATLGGKLLALAALLLIFVALALVAGALGSLLFGAILGTGLGFPSALTIVEGLAAGWLILAAWTLLGLALAVLFGNTAVAIGLGLVYALVLENVIGTIAIFVEQVRALRQAFLGANAGDLAAAFSGRDGGGTIGAPQATLALLGYVVALAALAAAIFRRRDVA